MPDQTTPDPREIARDIVRGPLWRGDIGEVIESRFPDLADDADAFDALHTQVDDLIGRAVVTVTLPGDPESTIYARMLRAFADRLETGPDVPLSPSVYAALAREHADDLDAEADRA